MKLTDIIKRYRYLLVIENQTYNTVDLFIFASLGEAIRKLSLKEAGHGSKDQAIVIDLITEKVRYTFVRTGDQVQLKEYSGEQNS